MSINGIRDLSGMKVGRLTVLYPTNMREHGYVVWHCKCDCGKECDVNSGELTRKRPILSCGCARIHTTTALTAEEVAISHVLKGMRRRCLAKTDKDYPRWGGRGITIDPKWLIPRKGTREFIKWAKTSGYAPGLTIDRIDNNGPYSPENCRWTTMKEQAANRRNTILIDVDGITKPAATWSHLLNDYTTHVAFLYKQYGKQEAVNYIREKLREQYDL